MTSAQTAVRQRAERHVWTGPLWLTGYLALVAAPIVALMLGRPQAGVEFWWDFAMVLGLAALSVMGIQFALTARIPNATAPFGADLVYVFHRYLAWVGLGLSGSHFLVLYLLYGDNLGSLDPRVAAWELTAARIALVAFGLAVITSEFRKILRLNYGAWRYLHVVLALLGLGAAIAHVVGTGRLSQTPASLVVWAGLTLVWAGLVVWLRMIKPIALRRRPYRVVSVTAERGEAWTLALEPYGWPGIAGFSPGQFIWLNLSSSPFALRDHPFSISSSPEALPRLEVTIKALGDFTGAIGDTPPGRRAWVDGPFGAFTTDRYPQATGWVFIVGGIGITPVMSMLRTLAERADTRPIWLFYANPQWDDVTFREEIDVLETRLSATVVHVIEDPPADFEGEAGLLDAAVLRRHLPTEKDGLRYFLCGPVPLTDLAETELRALGVHASDVRTELFELA